MCNFTTQKNAKFYLMGNFLSNMQSRYTVKKYDPDKKLTEEQLKMLENILQLSPSSINSQPWKFTFVKTSELKAKLAEASYFNKEKIDACTCLVVFQVLKKAEDFEKQIHENLPEGSVNYYNRVLKPLGEAAVEGWMKNQVYLALGILLAACAQEKIDSTPMEGIETDKYDEILNNDKYTTLFSVALGVHAADDANQPSLKPKSRLDIKTVIEER